MHILGKLLLLLLELGKPGVEVTPLVLGCCHGHAVAPGEQAMPVAGVAQVEACTKAMQQAGLERLLYANIVDQVVVWECESITRELKATVLQLQWKKLASVASHEGHWNHSQLCRTPPKSKYCDSTTTAHCHTCA